MEVDTLNTWNVEGKKRKRKEKRKERREEGRKEKERKGKEGRRRKKELATFYDCLFFLLKYLNIEEMC